MVFLTESDLQTKDDFVESSKFGKIPLMALKPEAVQIAVDASEALGPFGQAYYEQPLTNEFIEKATAYRAKVGAAYVYLMRQIAADLETVYSTTDRYWWTCFRRSVFSRAYRPLKFFRACGRRDEGVNLTIGRLLGLPHHRELARHWGAFPPELDHGAGLSASRDQLLNLELEYRNAATAMAQIGIGIGGMYLGLIGLLISFVLTLWPNR